jgi:hypothetical protein
MKALSIKQPWADWVLGKNLPIGIQPKDIENRSRKTNFRGEFYIHASQKFADDAFQWFRDTFKVQPIIDRTKYTTGAIIGKSELHDVEWSGEAGKLSGWEMHPFYLWYLNTDAIKIIEPIPAKGFLGFWDCSKYIESTVPVRESPCQSVYYQCKKCGNIITREQFKKAGCYFRCDGRIHTEVKAYGNIYDQYTPCNSSLKHYKRIEK